MFVDGFSIFQRCWKAVDEDNWLERFSRLAPLALKSSLRSLRSFRKTSRSSGYRSSPQDEIAYVINDKWIHVFTARLGFIVIFEHFVLVIKILLAYVIPDAPNNLRVQLQRERQNLREAQFQEEQMRPFTGPNYHNYEPEDLEEPTPEPSVLNSLSAASSRRLNSVSPHDTTITTLTKSDKK